ncbi:Ral GTPase-activating protein subunit alpha/beta N-terminal domain-containing protein [Entamoeba marina]
MFLSTAHDLRLLEVDEKSNLYQMFTSKVQFSLASQITKQILNNVDAFNQSILTSSHLDYVLESIGFSFKLPLTESETIFHAITVYKHWLFTEQQPQPLRNNLSHYFNTMIKHMSLIFTPRSATSSQQTLHVSYCNAVLDLFEESLKNDSITDIDLLLRLLLASMEAISISVDKQTPPLAISVGGRTISLLYSVWLKLKPSDPLLWKTIHHHHATWARFQPVAQVWSTFINTIFTSLMATLYDNSPCQISFPENETTIQLDPNYLQKLWISFLHCIGHPLYSNDPTVFETIVFCISEQIDEMITRKCNGETILRVFSVIHHSIVFPPHQRFSTGVSSLVRSLCQIFSNGNPCDFSSKNVSLFFHTLAHALASDCDAVFCTALKGYSEVARQGFEGAEIVMKTVLHAINRALMLKDPERTEMKEVILKVLDVIISVGNVNIPYVPTQQSETKEELFLELLARNLYIFFKRETQPTRLYAILSLLHRYFIEHLPVQKDAQHSTFTPGDVSTKSPESASALPWYFIKAVSLNSKNYFSSKNPEIHREIFSIFCLLLEHSSHIPCSSQFKSEVFTIIKSFYEKWTAPNDVVIMADCIPIVTQYARIVLPNISEKDMSSITQLYRKLSQSADYNKTKPSLITNDPSDGLSYYSAHLSHSISFFYNTLMSTIPTSQLSEVSISKYFKHQISDFTDNIFMVTVDNSLILSFIELPSHAKDGMKDFIVISRDLVGKSSYMLSLKDTQTPPRLVKIPSPSTPDAPITGDTLPHDDLLKSLTDFQSSSVSPFLNSPPQRKNPTTLQVSPLAYDDLLNLPNASSFYASRLFISNMGCASFANWNRFTSLQINSESLSQLSQLDAISSRLHTFVDIVHHGPDLSVLSGILPQLGSLHSSIESSDTSKQSVVFSYADNFVDVVYKTNVLDTVTPSTPSDIVIHFAPKDTSALQEDTHFVIIIQPLCSNSYNVQCNREIAPLREKQTVLLSRLGALIKETCIAFAYQRANETHSYPSNQRAMQIKEISTTFSNKNGNVPFMELLFSRELTKNLNTDKATGLEEPKSTKSTKKF